MVRGAGADIECVVDADVHVMKGNKQQLQYDDGMMKEKGKEQQQVQSDTTKPKHHPTCLPKLRHQHRAGQDAAHVEEGHITPTITTTVAPFGPSLGRHHGGEPVPALLLQARDAGKGEGGQHLIERGVWICVNPSIDRSTR